MCNNVLVLSVAAALVMPVAGQTWAAAPIPELPLSSAADAILFARKDAGTLNPKDLPYIRWLWSTHPTTLFRRVFQLHWNLTNRCSDISRPFPVTQWLWRVDLRETGRNPGQWENAANTDPFLHVKTPLAKDVAFVRYWPGGTDYSEGRKNVKRQEYTEQKKAGDVVTLSGPLLPVAELNDLRKMTFSESPVLMAEWLFSNEARQRNLYNRDDSGIGYYDVMQLTNRQDYFDLIKFRAEDSKSFGREFRAAKDVSGINPQGRQIGRGTTNGGGLWFTLDTSNASGKGVALRNLEPGKYKHDTEEHYAPLPNGLPATLLCDNNGKLQNVAPGDTHGLHDTSSPNESKSQTLHPGPGISCGNCHAGPVLKTFRDDVRDMYDGKDGGSFLVLGTINKKVDLQFKRLYLTDIYFWLKRDSEDYQRAVNLATILDPNDPNDKGLTSTQAWKAYSREFYRYTNDPMTVQSAARELGVPVKLWVDALVQYAKPLNAATLIDVPLSRFLMGKKGLKGEFVWTPKTIARTTWEDSYPLAYQVLADHLLLLSTKGKVKVP